MNAAATVQAPLERHRIVDPLRVLHVLPDLAMGGGQAVVLNQIRYTPADRVRFSVAYLDPVHDMYDRFVEAGHDPVFLFGTSGGRVRLVRRLARLIRERSIDLVHVHSDADRKVGQAAAFLCQVPVVAHLHSEWVHLGPQQPDGASTWTRAAAAARGSLRDALERVAVKRYLAVSHDVEQLFAPLVDAPLELVGQLVDVERFAGGGPRDPGRLMAALGIERGDGVLVNVGRMSPGKGHVDLIEMMSHLQQVGRRPTLLLVGDGELAPELQTAAERHGVADRVRFLGNRTDVAELLGIADLFVFASRSEGLPLSVVEAMAAAVPVVAYDLPSLVTMIDDGIDGVLVPHDPAALARAALAMLQEPGLASRIGGRARERALRDFDPRRASECIERVYADVIEPRDERSRRYGGPR